MLVVHVVRFATELADFAATLARTDLASPLTTLAQHLPQLARGEPCIRQPGTLAQALSQAASLLATTRTEGVAPQRLVSRLECRLTRLFGIGIGLPTHQQRPRALAPYSARSLRGSRRLPAVRIAAFG